MNEPTTVAELVEGALRDAYAEFFKAGGVFIDRTYIEDGRLVVEGHGIPAGFAAVGEPLDIGIVDRRLSDPEDVPLLATLGHSPACGGDDDWHRPSNGHCADCGCIGCHLATHQ